MTVRCLRTLIIMYIQQDVFVKVKDNVIRDLHHAPRRPARLVG